MTIENEVDQEWVETERSNAAEEVILREYHYHALRAAELKGFLLNCGIAFDE